MTCQSLEEEDTKAVTKSPDCISTQLSQVKTAAQSGRFKCWSGGEVQVASTTNALIRFRFLKKKTNKQTNNKSVYMRNGTSICKDFFFFCWNHLQNKQLIKKDDMHMNRTLEVLIVSLPLSSPATSCLGDTCARITGWGSGRGLLCTYEECRK